MSRNSMAIAAALASVLSFSEAHAAGGLYLGGGIGEATLTADTTAGKFDEKDTAYKVFAGYRFNMIPIIDLAAEGGYIDFGKPSQNVGAQRAQFKLHGAYAAGLLIFPLGPLDLYGKGGALYSNLDRTVGSNVNTRSGTDAFYGVGVGFYLWKIGLRAEYERFQVKDVDRVQMLSVSALFQF